MKKAILFMFLLSLNIQAQTNKYWNRFENSKKEIIQNNYSKRENFPKEFSLYNLDLKEIREALLNFNKIKGKTDKKTIYIPTTTNQFEEFEIFEASNFDKELQEKFPEIRAYSGKSLTDKTATLKISISPYGIQTTIFRADNENEFIEPYSKDNTIYAVYKSKREKNNIAWTCSTDDKQTHDLISKEINKNNSTQRANNNVLKTMRLAQSCTGEYSQFHATAVGQPASVAVSLAAINNTLTRCNGVYEKDLALHLFLVASSTNVIYTNAATDPYGSTDDNYNSELQTTLTNIIGEDNYDIGHLFSAVGGATGNGNAGCIGCVCESGKGSGFTTRAVPQGDDFDIDFVVHEVGHQLGANHTFTMSPERSGNNMEPGSGITIMGYAGITSQDLAQHSIDTFHATSINQIQNNLVNKSCTINNPANNDAPLVNAGKDYTIPKSTPFILEGNATDANGDSLTYQWEQFDHDTANQTGTSSDADPAKTVGPNWISWAPVTSNYRYMPRVSSIIANSATTTATGNDAGILSEALSSVDRTLNFRLTVRDNHAFSSLAPTSAAQTNYDDMKVSVDGTAGPFSVTVPSNSGLSYVAGSNQTVTWNVASTNSGKVNCPFVDIYLFTNNSLSNGILLSSKVPNDGSETITIPNNVGTINRIMVRGHDNIFFDISNNNFAITSPSSSFAVQTSGTSGDQYRSTCQTSNTIEYTFNYNTLAGFNNTTNFTATGVPANTTVNFSPSSRTTTGTVTMTVTTTGTTPTGLSNIIVNATSGATTKTLPLYLEVFAPTGVTNLSSPANNANTQNTKLTLSWNSSTNATSYIVEVSTNNTFTNIINNSEVSTSSYEINNLSQGTNYYWRVTPKNSGCGLGTPSSTFKFTTGIINCSTVSNNTVRTISNIGKPTVTSTINIPSGVSILDLNLTTNITHGYVSDLTVTLTGPTGTSVVIIDGICDSSTDINATFDDSGSPLTCASDPAISGTVAPTNPLSVFNGTSSTGTWTLTIKDNISGDGGSLNSWSLNICDIQTALSNPNLEFADLKLYPNPNKGNFNIELNSDSSENIQINVFDIRGREILNKTYKASGSFNQNIDLQNAKSGVYLVTISDGTKKTVKRIIIE
jgi:subtilisin-like proprotein convertase family protein